MTEQVTEKNKRNVSEKLNKAKGIAKDSIIVGGVVGTTAVGILIPAKFILGVAIPTLMINGATVVSGVGSIMPWWIGPIQAASMVGLAGLAAPAVIIGGTAAAGYGGYRLIKLYYSESGYLFIKLFKIFCPLIYVLNYLNCNWKLLLFNFNVRK